MNSLTTLHNQRIPLMPPGQGLMVWLAVGQAVVINGHSALSAMTETEDGDTRLVLRIHLRGGATFRADEPEGLAHLTTDAVVRRVRSDAAGRPQRVLVEIGDMVAYPHLRKQVAA